MDLRLAIWAKGLEERVLLDYSRFVALSLELDLRLHNACQHVG